MPFKIVRNDITKMQVDAIVYTANSKTASHINEGEAAITPAVSLPARYIIHAGYLTYKDGNSSEEKKLRGYYRKSLSLAVQHQCKSIAFPLNATESIAYSKEEGLRIALDEITTFLKKQDMHIFLVVTDIPETNLGATLYSDLEIYIDNNYKGKIRGEGTIKKASSKRQIGGAVHKMQDYSMDTCLPSCKESACIEERDDSYYDFLKEKESALEERMKHMSDTFQQYLMYLIEMKKLTNAEVYKRAIVTKQLFSKIKLNPNYHPDKSTAMRLCVGARLNLDETRDLLARAGYALSPCDKRDIIFSFFIEHEVFDMIEIDIALEEHGLPCFIE